MPQNFKINAYTRNQPEAVLFPAPVIANRAPTTADKNYAIGQLWIEPKNTSNVAVNAAWILTSIINNLANWADITGGAGVFTTLTVTGLSTLGATTIVGTANINASGAATTTIGTGGTGAVNIGNATGNTAVTGNMTVTGNITSTTGNIAATLGSLAAGTSVTAGTSITSTLGNITATNGNLVMSTLGNKLVIPTAASGTNASVGTTAAMAAGTIVVANTAVTANSIILVSHATAAGTLGQLSIGTITPGVNFAILTDNVLDVSTVNFLIIN